MKRFFFVLTLVSLTGCTATFDSAGDRIDASVDRAVLKLKEATDDTVKRAIDEADKKLEARVTDLTQKVTSLPSTFATEIKATVSKEVSQLRSDFESKLTGLIPEDQREMFKRDLQEKGVIRAVKDWAVELIVALTGTSSLGFVATWLSRRKRKRLENEGKLKDQAMGTFVQAIERTGADNVKQAIEQLLKSGNDPDNEYEIRKLVSRAKSQIRGMM